MNLTGLVARSPNRSAGPAQ